MVVKLGVADLFLGGHEIQYNLKVHLGDNIYHIWQQNIFRKEI